MSYLVSRLIILILLVSRYNYFYLVDASPEAPAERYCKLKCGKVENSACKCHFASRCKKGRKMVLLNDAERTQMIKIHNDMREALAINQSASNMKALVYDFEMERVAQCHANQCKGKDHDKCRKTPTYGSAGQNIWIIRGLICETKTTSLSVHAWKKEDVHMTGPDYDTFKLIVNKSVVGHWTQVVWANAETVGCGRMQQAKTCIVICNYGPSGNVGGKPIFLRGDLKCTPAAGYTRLCKGKDGPIGKRDLADECPTLQPVVTLYSFVICLYIYSITTYT